MTDAAAAAAERARSMPLTPVDPPAAVIRALEDAALPRIDPDVARRFIDLDRRFDRAVSVLRQELARRHEAMPAEAVGRPVSGWDMSGFLVALLSAPLLLVAGQAVLPPPLAAATATVMVVAAACLHAIGAVRARRDGGAVAASRHLVLLTAGMALASAALLVWRSGGSFDAPVVVECMLALLAAALCTALFIPASREARVDAVARRAGLDAERERRADLEARLADAIESAREESWTLLGRLTAAQREELRAAVTEAVRALGRRELLEPAVLRELRTADPGQLRYAAAL